MDKDWDKIYMEIIALDEIYNFIADNFFIWNLLDIQIYDSGSNGTICGPVWHSSSSSSTPPGAGAQPNSFSSTKTGSGVGWSSLTKRTRVVELGLGSSTTPLQTQLLELYIGVEAVPNRPNFYIMHFVSSEDLKVVGSSKHLSLYSSILQLLKVKSC